MENERRRNRWLRRADDRTLQHAQALIASLEMIGDGVILLDGNANVVFASEFAYAILEGEMEYVWIKDDRLHFNDHHVEQQLELTLARLIHHKKSVLQSNALVIRRASPKPPLVMSLFPLPSLDGQDSHDRSTPCMMIILRDPENVPMPQWQVFTQHFQLSSSETRLCLALADGLSISEYSKKYCISTHTARTHLKSVFFKTSTRRQADLLRLIFMFTRL